MPQQLFDGAVFRCPTTKPPNPPEAPQRLVFSIYVQDCVVPPSVLLSIHLCIYIYIMKIALRIVIVLYIYIYICSLSLALLAKAFYYSKLFCIQFFFQFPVPAFFSREKKNIRKAIFAFLNVCIYLYESNIVLFFSSRYKCIP